MVRHDKRLRELAVGLFKQGCGRRYAARQLGVSESVVRKPDFCSLEGLFDASDLRKQPLFL